MIRMLCVLFWYFMMQIKPGSFIWLDTQARCHLNVQLILPSLNFKLLSLRRTKKLKAHNDSDSWYRSMGGINWSQRIEAYRMRPMAQKFPRQTVFNWSGPDWSPLYLEFLYNSSVCGVGFCFGIYRWNCAFQHC